MNRRDIERPTGAVDGQLIKSDHDIWMLERLRGSVCLDL